MSKIKYIDIKEFREKGYLQEVNRTYLHPLGLALEITQKEDGTEYISGIWDYRDDPEGMAYGEGTIDVDKVANIREEWNKRVPDRLAKLGYVIQPLFIGE